MARTRSAGGAGGDELPPPIRICGDLVAGRCRGNCVSWGSDGRSGLPCRKSARPVVSNGGAVGRRMVQDVEKEVRMGSAVAETKAAVG